MHRGVEGDDALVRVGHLQLGRLADDDAGRPRQVDAHPCDGVEDAAAGRLLVIAQHDVDRRLKGRGLHLVDHRQCDRRKALHVDRPAPVGPAVGNAQPEGIARPGLARDRHHVGVPGQHDATAIRRPDGGEDRRLGPGGIRHAHEADPVTDEIVLDIGNEREIAEAAFRVEGDQPGEDAKRRIVGGGNHAHAVIITQLRTKSATAGAATLRLSGRPVACAGCPGRTPGSRRR